jgi:hypothetical protein
MNKKTLSERDICTKFITPALVRAGWDVQAQIGEEVPLTKGRVIVSGRVHRRGEAKRAEYVLNYNPNLPLAIIEAKDNNHTIGAGMQQALEGFDVKELGVAAPGEAPKKQLKSRLVVAKRHGNHAPPVKPGVYDLFVSVGKLDGTPTIALPMRGDDGQRRYHVGPVTIKP